jgi:hypothetical protein
LLGAGDHARVEPGAPVLAMRAAQATPRVEALRAPTIAATPAPAGGALTKTDGSEKPSGPASAARALSQRGAERLAKQRTLDKQAVQRVIRATLPQLSGCYQQSRAGLPNLGGRIVIGMKVVNENGEGRVEEAEVLPPADGKEDLNSPDTEHCLLAVLANARFPPPRPGQSVAIRYPFILLPDPVDQERREALYQRAQKAYVLGQYREAISIGRRIQGLVPQAWRIIGAASCFLNERAGAAEAWAQLDPQGRQFLQHVCSRSRINLP